MERRSFLSAIGGAAASAAILQSAFPGQAVKAKDAKAGGATTSSGSSSAKPPNVIFILADDLGWGDLGCYGNTVIRTPNLDRLAAQGTLFTQFYVCGSVCSPSRTAFMTGGYPARYRVHGHFATDAANEARGMPNWLDPAAPFLARLLKDKGYATAHFGKWHLGSGPKAPTPADYGFTVSRTVNANGPNWDSERDAFFRAKSSELIVDETIQFIEANKDKPFYVNVWSLVPHAPLNPTEEQMELYAGRGPRAPIPHKGAIQIFGASVSDLDAQVGRLLAKLEELGLAENTLVLFSSDNGPEDIHLGEASHSGIGSAGPFRGRKRSLYEGGIRVPGIVRWPARVPAGRVDDQSVVAGVDWLPTLCKLVGIEPPDKDKLDGEDVGDIFAGKSRPRTRPLLWEWRFRILGDVMHQSPMLAIRDGDWKFLANPDGSRKELYDIVRDRGQVDNVADQHADVVKRLSEQLIAWQKTLPPGPTDPGVGGNRYPWPGEKPPPPQPALGAGKMGGAKKAAPKKKKK